MSRKKSRRTPRKPTGTTGHLSLDPHTRTAEFVMVKFPSTKPEIEQYVLDCTLAIVRKMGRNLYRLTAPAFQNFEQDFDFTLPTENGTQYLDLMEMKPTSGPYSAAPGSYRVWDFAQAIYGEIIKKAQKYGPNRRDVIHLLLYSTDHRFQPDFGVFQLLKVWLGQKRHCFRSVLHYSPADQNSGELLRLFRTTPEERRCDIAELRERVIMMADFTKLEVDAEGGASVPISPPPAGWRS